MAQLQEAPRETTEPWLDAFEPVEAPARRGRALARRSGVHRWGPPVLLLILCLVLWQVVLELTDTPTYLIAKPSGMFSSLGSNFSELMSQTLPTFIEVILGFAASVGIGVPIAVAVVYSRRVGSALYPLVVASQVVPKVAIAPIFVILLGTGLLPKVILAFLIAFFPVVVNTVTGLRSVEPEMLELVRSMGAGQLRAFVKVRFPAALPFIFSGLKIAMTLAVVGALVAEFVGASKGLGYSILVATGNVDTKLVYADLLVMTILGVVLYGALELIEAILLRGRRAPSPEVAGQFSM